MKNRVSLVLVVVLLYLICFKNVSANELCSSKGYTVLTVNGIFTDIASAKANSYALGHKFDNQYNNQSLTVDYLYNPSHIGGLGDIIDYVRQGFFDQKSDYDLTEMLNDASQKVKTQKILLVAHSQGNFYANNFYDKVASKEGGVPGQSIGVYSIATPASRVAGGGKYLTSDTDQVIASLVGGTLKRNILKPDTHITFQKNDDGGQGHDFSKIYLKYQGNKIISDIKASLDKLKSNDEQDAEDLCISPPKLSAMHKIQGVALNTADFVVNSVKNVVVAVVKGVSNATVAIGNGIYNSSKAVTGAVGGLLANVVSGVPNSAISGLTAGPISPLDSSSNDLSQNNSDTATTVSDSSSGDGSVAVASQPETQNDGTGTENSGGGGGGGGGSSSTPTSPVVSPTPDTTAPVINVLGNNPETIIVGSTYTDAGATALDYVDGARDVITAGVVDPTTVGVYTLTYTATDLSENIGTATRTINVIATTPSSSTSNVLYSQPDSSTEINFSSVSSFDTFTGESGHIQGIKFAYNDHGISTGNFIGVSVVDRTAEINYYGTEEDSTSCGNTYELTGANAKVIAELDSATHFKAYPCTGPDLVLDPTHTYGVALFPNNFTSGTVRFYGANNNNDAVYLEITDDSIPATGKSIKSFKIPNLGATGVIDEVNHQIAISVPFGTNVSALAPVIKISGGASVVPSSNTPQNFSNPVNYIITAQNGLSETYRVTVSVRPNVIYSQPNNSVEITGVGNIFLQNLFTGAVGKITDLKFSYNDYGSGPDQFIGVQIVDQNTLKSYYAWKSGVGEGCGDAYQSHSVNAPVIVELDSTFEYRGYPCTGANLILDPTHTYSVSLFRNHGGSPADTQRFYGSSSSSSDAFFYIESDGIASLPPTPPVTPDPSLGSEKAITAFSFSSLTPNVVGTINETDHTIALTVPFGTDATTLTPTIAISDKAKVSPGNNVAQNFSSPVVYTVTAEDNSTQTYTVTVTIASKLIPPDTTPPVISALSLSAPSTKYNYVKIGGIINLAITADAPGYTAKAISINNVPATNFKDNGDGTYGASYTVSPGDNDITSGNIPVSVILADTAGNSNVADTTVEKNVLKIDAHAPTLVSAKVTAPLSVEVTFSEDINGSTVNSTGDEFTVSGHDVSSAHELDGVVTLSLSLASTIASGETPNVTFSSTSFEDIAGNQAVSPATVISTNNM